MIKKFELTLICDQCGIENQINDLETALNDFEENWYTNIALDLCERCRTSTNGLKRIALYENHRLLRRQPEINN